MTEENKRNEYDSPALAERESSKKVIAGLRETIALKEKDINLLQDDLNKLEMIIDQKTREFESEQARRTKAESLLSETKKLDKTGQHIHQKAMMKSLLIFMKLNKSWLHKEKLIILV
ncbi:MAG: hypothetical protein mread185_000230 [Mycoplasmataceae bacterium]|nr:MAG: hypothetical protein mread185_000230 [Mycoplasmataceae bacterium]